MKNQTPIYLEQFFAASVPIVWDCLTQIKHLQQWLFKELKHFKPEPFFTTEFAYDYKGKTFTHCWEVMDIIPQKQLVLGWRYKEYPGVAKVRFKLSTSPNGCIVELTENLIDPFPEIEEFKRKNRKAGWKDLLHTRLFNYIIDFLE